MPLSRDIIKEIKDRLDIVNIIGEYVHSLKKTGKNWIGLCPFHNDKSPSFSVSSDFGFYKCFACGESGDVISFIQKIEGLDFQETLDFLSKKAGIDLTGSKERAESGTRKDDLIQFNHRLVKLFHHFLMESSDGTRARQYLNERGISQEIIEEFKLGYAPAGYQRLENIIRKKGFNDDFLVQTGVFSRGERGLKTLFFDRVMFPIFNNRNECTGFGGRALNNEIKPKYINSPETAVYKKSFNLYGINTAKDVIKSEKRVYIVEGYVDVISCYKNGIKNAVAPCGTALTADQIKLLKRYTDHIILLMDGDEAGLKGVVKALREFANIESVKTSVLILPDGMDPDDYFKNHDRNDFNELEKKALDGYDFMVLYAARNRDIKNYTELLNILNDLFSYIVLWSNQIVRASLLERMCKLLNLDDALIKNEFSVFVQKGSQKSHRNEMIKEPVKPVRIAELNDLVRRELDLILLLSLVSNSSELIRASGLENRHFSDDECRMLFEGLSAGSEDFRKEFLDRIENDNFKNYVNNRLFSDEFKQDDLILYNNAVDRIADLLRKHYQRINEEISEKIKLCELYKEEELIRELQEEKTIIIFEIRKLLKLQELKK